jgi:hypothetical protein
MTKKKSAAKAGDNSKRALEAAEAAWDKLDRVDVFARGALLIKVRELVERGDWLPWLEARRWNDETARRAMNASRLADRFHILRDLDLPKTVIYELMDTYTDDDGKPDPELPDIIAALNTATKNATERLKVGDLKSVINRARQRFVYGDYPEATCDALDSICNDDAEPDEWVKAAIDALKTQGPAVKKEADKIVFEFHHAHVAKLYAEHGVLPKMADDGWDGHEALTDLEEERFVPPERRARVLERLLAAPQPLTAEKVDEIINSNDGAEQGGQGEQGEKPEPKPEPESNKSNTKPTGKHGGGGAAGADSKAEIKRLKADSKAEINLLKKEIYDLRNKINAFKGTIDTRDGEIKDLKAEIKKLKVDSKGPIEKHVEALVAALKKTTSEKQELTIEDLCKRLGIDPHKLNPPNSKAAA